MSPVQTAISTVNRAVGGAIGSFHPSSVPLMSRAPYRRELMAWAFLPVMHGAVEGGIVGVLVKNAFDGAPGVSPRLLNVAVAILATAPAFANVTSFIWAALNHGRAKIRFVVTMQIVTAALVGVIALAPVSVQGLVLVTLAVVGARVCWSGVVTVRSTVWRANYPRSDRARLAGKLAAVQALVITVVGLAIGGAMKADPAAFRLLYPIAGGVGLVGVWFYSGVRVRRHRALVRAERDEPASALANPMELVRVLRADGWYRAYQACMFVFGLGNLMVAAPLIIMLRDRFHLGYLPGILIVSSLPTALMVSSIPFWSRLLDRMHVVRFRAFHSWTHVAAVGLFFLGGVTTQPWLMFMAGAAKGIAFGGGALGWNLGHHDFASRHRAGRYMGVHVTLTGIRGLLAPVAAVGLYELLESIRPGAGPWVLALCLALSVAGAIGFGLMTRALPDRGKSVSRPGK